MAESQKALNENRMKHLGRFAEQLPDVLSRIRDQAVETYKDGVLNSKIKRLMAMAIALGAGCRNCVLDGKGDVRAERALQSIPMKSMYFTKTKQ